MICPNKLTRSSLTFCSKLKSLCYHALCATLFQLDIYHSFHLRIVIHLKHWIPNLLSFKTYMTCPKKLNISSLDFHSKSISLCYHGSQNKNFQETFFFSWVIIESQKETSRFLLFSLVTIYGYKKLKFTIIKISMLHIKELITHLLKQKDFYTPCGVYNPS